MERLLLCVGRNYLALAACRTAAACVLKLSVPDNSRNLRNVIQPRTLPRQLSISTNPTVTSSTVPSRKQGPSECRKELVLVEEALLGLEGLRDGLKLFVEYIP